MDDPAAAATASSAFAWRRTLAAVGAHAEKEREQLVRRRVEEMEAAVAWLRAEKEAVERKAAALREELESERGFAAAAASEAMLMIGRLQREKSAAMIEAREFRCIVEGRAGRDEEIEDWLAEAYGLASSYRDHLRAHGIDPDEDVEEDESEAAVNGDDNRSSSTDVKGVVVEEPLPTSLRQTSAAEELKIRPAVTTKAVAEAEDLCARVAALEADSAAVRREMAVERAQIALAGEAARRLCRNAAATRAVVVPATEKQRFSVLAVFKWFCSAILRGTKRSAFATRALRHPGSSASSLTSYFRLWLLPLLERFKGTLQIQSRNLWKWKWWTLL